MNILHLKYAVEVEKTCSLNRAAENLFVSQPNLSRAIKELEETLGVTLFKRTSKGMFPTAQGEEFLEYAREILAQIDRVERLYQSGKDAPQQLSISVPRADHIAQAFSEFVSSLQPEDAIDLNYRETNSMRAINNIVQADYHLAIIRYRQEYERYFTTMLYDKGIKFRPMAEFIKRAVMSESHPLRDARPLTRAALDDYIELAHGDPYVPSLPAADVKKTELPAKDARRISIYERATAFELLSSGCNAFMMVSPMPERTLAEHRLVQRRVADYSVIYRDALIFKKEYALSRQDKRFVELVRDAAEKIDGITLLD